MVIEIKNLSIKYKNDIVLDKANVSFSKPGLYFLLGPSGSGKSSFIHACNDLIPFDGKILFNNINPFIKNEKEKNLFFSQNIAMVFQDNRLFPFLNAYENVELSLSSFNMDEDLKRRKIMDAFEFVNMKNFLNAKTNKLSGGESQRVALARAIVKDPSFLFADEPTGSLDEKNSEEIMKLLFQYSKNKIVIVVTHNIFLAEKYGDEVYTIENKKIIKTFSKKHSKKEKNNLLTNKINKENKINKLKFPFLSKIAKEKRKDHKVRSAIVKFSTSLGLLGIGLAFNISSFLKTSIKSNYAQILEDNEIIMSKKRDNNNNELSSIDKIEAVSRMQNYKEYILDTGVTYLNDFTSFFKDEDCFYIPGDGSKKIISNLSIDHINNFIWLDKHMNKNIYPSIPTKLDNDEFVLGLTQSQIRNVCFNLSIEKNAKSLSKYLENNDLYICLSIKNNDWQYEDEHIFKVKGFFLDYHPAVYHYNHLFNEYVFEELLRLPISYELEKPAYYPWTLKKTCFYDVYNNLDEFLFKTSLDYDFNDTYFDINNKLYFPLLFYMDYPNFYERFILLKREENSLRVTHLDYIKNLSKNIKNVYPIDGDAYSAYPSMLMKGFTNETLFSFDKLKLENLIELKSKVDIKEGEIENENEILKGHYSLTKNNGVFFKCLNSVDFGKSPQNYDEIVVSKGFLEKIGLNSNEIPSQTLYISNNVSSKIVGDNIYNSYSTAGVKVVGIVNSPLIEIYHDPTWLINFFLTRFHISILNLKINSFVVETNSYNQISEVKSILSKAFSSFEIITPIEDINESVDKLIFYLRLIIVFFSFTALVISIFLFSISMKIFLFENEKDIISIRLLGFSKIESVKMLIYCFFDLGFSSFLFSSFELLIFSLAFSFINKINPLSFISLEGFFVMFIVLIILLFFSGFPLIKKVLRKRYIFVE